MNKAALISLLFATPITITVGAVPAAEIFTAAPGQTITLSGKPSPFFREQVVVNGLICMPGEDYTLAGQVITFTKLPVESMQNPAIQVFYWKTLL